MQSRAGTLGGKKTPEGRLHPGAAEEASAKKPRTITIVPSRHIRIGFQNINNQYGGGVINIDGVFTCMMI